MAAAAAGGARMRAHATTTEGHGTDPSLLARTLLYSFNRCCADVIALSTDSRFTRDLMLDAVPYSSPSIFVTRATCTGLHNH